MDLFAYHGGKLQWHCVIQHSKSKNLQSGVIVAPVEAITALVSSMVMVKKQSGKLHICIKLKPLKWVFERCHYTLPIIENTLPELSKARICMVYDLRNGF